MSAIEVLKEMKENVHTFKIKRYEDALKEALLALEQKERLPELLANFVLTLYTPEQLELNNKIFGDTKKQFIKKAEVFLNDKKN